MIIGALLMSSRGLLPEVPSRPKRPVLVEKALDKGHTSESKTGVQNRLDAIEGEGN